VAAIKKKRSNFQKLEHDNVNANVILFSFFFIFHEIRVFYILHNGYAHGQ